jgi:hypothetical protein
MEAIQLVRRFLKKRGFGAEYGGYGSSKTSLKISKKTFWLGELAFDGMKVTLAYEPRRVRQKRNSVAMAKTFDLHDPDSLPSLLEALNSNFTLLTLDNL